MPFVFRSLNFRIISEIFSKNSFFDCQIISSYFFHLIRCPNFSFFISFLKSLSTTYCDLSFTIMKSEIRLIEFFLSKSSFFVYFKWITDMTEWIFILIDNFNSYCGGARPLDEKIKGKNLSCKINSIHHFFKN